RPACAVAVVLGGAVARAAVLIAVSRRCETFVSRVFVVTGQVVARDMFSELNPGLRHRDPQRPVTVVLRDHRHTQAILGDVAILVRRTHFPSPYSRYTRYCRPEA